VVKLRDYVVKKIFIRSSLKNNNSEVQASPAGNQTTKTIIFYFSGTGNSLWVARALARELGNTELVSMVDWDINQHNIDSQLIGLVFPVHIWGVPKRVLEFLDQLQAMSPEYIFAVPVEKGPLWQRIVNGAPKRPCSTVKTFGVAACRNYNSLTTHSTCVLVER
jgi:hypothetical protein